MDYTIKIGGEAGQGLQTIGGMLGKFFSRSGFHIFTHQDYMSRIRGGHNFYQVRFADFPITCSRSALNILIALDKKSMDEHRGELASEGIVLYDAETIKQKYAGREFLDVPFRKISLEKGHNIVMENTVAVGAVLGMFNMKTELAEKLLAETFEKKGREIIDQNIAALRAGYEHAKKECLQCGFKVAEARPEPGRLMLIDGTTALGLGALVSGVKFYSAYPMTPSTGILLYLAGKARKHGLVVEQAEDEIAAINMAIGGSFAGVRSATGTSGGGYALMVEGLSLAGMTETPIVIFLGQRPGPATGFPTRTEQGDLLNACFSSHGEFPRIVFAPGTPEEAVYLTNKAFDLAEKYQVPAFILFDTYLADSEWTLPGIDSAKLKYIDYRLRGKGLEDITGYKRHAFTETGVTPLAVPGASRNLVVTDSDEHDEEGHIVEDAETRVRMVEKRLLKKLPQIAREIGPPKIYGSPKAEIVLAGWGSTFGVLRACVDHLKDRYEIATMHFTELNPFPLREKFDYIKVLEGARLAICVENNATRQFARLMRMETGFNFTGHINKFDGRPFLLDPFVKEVEEKVAALMALSEGA